MTKRCRRKFVIPFYLIVFMVPLAYGSIFHIDPGSGSMNGNGSFNHPWSTFSEVLNNHLITSQKYSTPYNSANPDLIKINDNAPVNPGDTLLLYSGLHGSIFIKNYQNDKPIYIIAAEDEQPILKSLHIQSGSNWYFEGLTISSEPYDEYIHGRLVYFESHNWQGPAKNIIIKNCNVFSTETPWTEALDWNEKVSSGIYVKGDSMEIIGNTLSNISFGISLVGDHIYCAKNTIRNFSGDGMRMLGSYQIVEENYIANCYKVDDNHDDGIQSFTTNGYAVDHNVVRKNVILNYEDPDQVLLGPLQGIGCFDGFYNDWLVENNIVMVNHWHGISFYGANQVRIINNTVLDPTPGITPGASWIRINEHKDGRPSQDCIVSNNITNSLAGNAIYLTNVILANTSEYEAHFTDVKSYDVHLLQNSSIIDFGNNEYASTDDLDYNERPQGTAIDPGAFEYVLTSSLNDANVSELRIFPNPSSDYVHLHFDGPTHFFKILSQNGQIMYTSLIKKQDQIVDIKSWPPGVYFISYSKLGSENAIGKFIKI